MNDDIENRLESLERAVRLHTAMITSLESENADLKERLESLGKRRLPYLEVIPDAPSITQVRAELFHNPPRQGVPARVLKVFAWTCEKEQIKKYAEGNSQPFYLYMAQPEELDIGDGCSQIARVVEHIGKRPNHLVGCLHQRRKNGDKKGQRRYLGHSAVIDPGNHLLLLVNADVIDCGVPVRLKEGRADRASKHVWYFSR